MSEQQLNQLSNNNGGSLATNTLNQSSGTPVSKIDSYTGKHTSSIIVAILFILTLISLIVLECVKEKVPENLQTALIGIMGVFAGFYAGTNIKSENS